MVLLHGGTADHTRWAPVVPLLAERFTVHAVDRRGRGGSGDHPAYDIRREGEDVAAVVEAVGPDVFVVGHSYGALCALEAALITDAIGRMVLYEPPAATPGHVVAHPDVHAALRTAGTPEDILTTFYRGALHLTDDQIEAMRGTPVWRSRLAAAPTIVREIEAIEVFDLSARLSAISVPVRLLLGTESPAYFRPAAETIASRLADVEILSLSGQAHMAINEAPDLFVERVVSFWRP
jgi:pimeloyl-ACP methyl ester carboxylesterase